MISTYSQSLKFPEGVSLLLQVIRAQRATFVAVRPDPNILGNYLVFYRHTVELSPRAEGTTNG